MEFTIVVKGKVPQIVLDLFEALIDLATNILELYGIKAENISAGVALTDEVESV